MPANKLDIRINKIKVEKCDIKQLEKLKLKLK